MKRNDAEDNRLREYILESIKHSGFPLEMQVEGIFEKHIEKARKEKGKTGIEQVWHFIHPYNFVYLKEDYETEVDFLAQENADTSSAGERIEPYFLRCFLLTECKRDLNSWIFFKGRTALSDLFVHTDYIDVVRSQRELLDTYRKNPDWIRWETCPKEIFDSYELVVKDKMTAVSLLDSRRLGILDPMKDAFKNGLSAAFYQELETLDENRKPFGNQKLKESRPDFRHDKVRKATTSLCKALIMKYREFAIDNTYRHVPEYLIDIYIPIIVFEGDLFVYEKEKIEKVNHIMYYMNYLDLHYVVHVIAKDYFDGFLSQIENAVASTVDKIHDSRNLLDEQIKKIEK